MTNRRQFISKLTAPFLAMPVLSELAFPSCANPYEGPVLKVALMGLGGYASRVADAMQACKKARITGLISGTPEKLKSWQQKYNVSAKNCYNYENFDAIKNNPEIDAVYILTP